LSCTPSSVSEVGNLRNGSVWGEDDGIEVAIAGAGAGAGATYVLRGFADGTVRSVTDGGATAEAASRLGAGVNFVAKPFVRTKSGWGGWRAEWAIPLAALGLKATPGVTFGFNIAVFRAEDRELRMLEGTLTESWQVDQAATLQLK
jgi:hypothetical protein